VATEQERVRTIARFTGCVQGVGFRFQVLRIAQRFAVAGTVRNLHVADALEIDCEGLAPEVERFLAAVIAQPPPRGRIESVERIAAQPRGLDSFSIDSGSG
jgi:hydrogenase maturation protein HypF